MEERKRVIVTGLEIGIVDLMLLLIRLAVAAIPATIILGGALFALLMSLGVFGALLGRY